MEENMEGIKLPKEANGANYNVEESEQNLNENILEKLKGDTIGDTVYSERFVLKTLLALQDIEWNETFETELCTLWDMTTDLDIAIYLANNNFFDILVLSVVDNLENVRLVEILIGITANICSKSECIEILFSKTETVDFLFNLLSYPDASTLIQLVRFFQVVLCNKNTNCYLRVLDRKNDKSFIDNLSLIIKNSTKMELLTEIFKFLSSVAYYEKKLNHNQILLLNRDLLSTFIQFLDENNCFQEITQEMVELISSSFNVIIEMSFFINTLEQEQFKSYKTLLSEFKPIYTFLFNLLNELLFSDGLEKIDLQEILMNLSDIILELNIYDCSLLSCLIRACKNIFEENLNSLIHSNIIYLLIFAKIENITEFFKNCSPDDRKFLFNLVANYPNIENNDTGFNQNHIDALKTKLLQIKLD